MKGYLKNSENYVSLSPKITTIGREGCDITVQAPTIDLQHAVIEHSESDNCFILKDLNTTQGTYVNDVRVQNAAVRLAPGDVIRFGYPGVPYELGIEASVPQTAPPPQQPSVLTHRRSAWTPPLTSQRDQPVYTQLPTSNLPCLTGPALSCTMWSQPIHQSVPAVARVPVFNRPLSAGNNRKSSFERIQTISKDVSVNPPLTNGYMSQRTNGGILPLASGITQGRPPSGNGGQTYRKTDDSGFALLQEKDQKISQLINEVNRLKVVEYESGEKDRVIEQLQHESLSKDGIIHEMHQKMSLLDHRAEMFMDPDMTVKLMSLENELTARDLEIVSLSGQLRQVTVEPREPSVNLRDELNEKVVEVTDLRSDLVKVRKDKNIVSGLVTQLQRDMTNKDTSISRLSREIEKLKVELREKEIDISAMVSKMYKMKENDKGEEQTARDKELKFKSAENKVAEREETITTLKGEITVMKKSQLDEKREQIELKNVCETVKKQVGDLEKVERVVRTDLEQTSNRLFRFRNRVIQIAYSVPGVDTPTEELSDDDVIESLKSTVSIAMEAKRQIEDMERKLQETTAKLTEFSMKSDKLKLHMSETMDRLSDKGRLSCNIKQEMELLQFDDVDESVEWVRQMCHRLLSDSLAWQTGIEESLEMCGVNISLTNEGPAEHIKQLRCKWEEAFRERDRLWGELDEARKQHRVEMENVTAIHKQEVAAFIKEAVERTKLEGELAINAAIDDIRCLENDKRENAVKESEEKIEELEGRVTQLRESLANRDSEMEAKLADALAQYEEATKAAEQAHVDIRTTEATKTDDIEKMKAETMAEEEKLNEVLASYKEQIRQHSVTIVAMETKMQKISKKHKDAQAHISELKKTVQELKNKPEPRPVVQKVPIKPVQEIVAMEQALLTFRRETVELKQQCAGQQEIIMTLRRDLEGAAARMSDVTGELSEKQKQDMESSQDMLGKRDKELTELRQQMVKLSAVVDKQKAEIHALTADLSEEKTSITKRQREDDDKDVKIQMLEERLVEGREEKRKQIEVTEQEGKITGELTALGAQCRGERHEKVIARQREALAELRTRIKSLEQTNPPLPSQDQALQQVISLKKELTEMRSSQAMTDDHKHHRATSSLDRQVDRVRGMGAAFDPEMDMEKSAHRDSLASLENSETSYLTLLRAMASCVDLPEVHGLRSMANLPRDERTRLHREREESCELIASRIKALKERVNRKDDLLQGYETDLVKMRTAQDIAQKKSLDVENLTDDVRRSIEEAQYLRECLKRTKQLLDQEKRLNCAIKQKKTFHLENERAHLAQTPKVHKCQQEDIFGKESARSKTQGDLLKKREYEVKSLKQQLYDRERQIIEKERKLINMEASLGFSNNPVSVVK